MAPLGQSTMWHCFAHLLSNQHLPVFEFENISSSAIAFLVMAVENPPSIYECMAFWYMVLPEGKKTRA